MIGSRMRHEFIEYVILTFRVDPVLSSFDKLEHIAAIPLTILRTLLVSPENLRLS
jgi:hypothetical protein